MKKNRSRKEKSMRRRKRIREGRTGKDYNMRRIREGRMESNHCMRK